MKQALLLGAVLVFAFWISRLAIDSEIIQEAVRTFGYVGIFFFAAVSGFNIIVPIPIIAFLPAFVASGLFFWPTVFVISIGMTVGDAFGYLIGRVGKTAVEATPQADRVLSKIKTIQEKYPRAPLALLLLWVGFVPLPNEILVIPLAVLGYRFRYIFVIVLLGNVVFNSLVALGVMRVVGVFG